MSRTFQKRSSSVGWLLASLAASLTACSSNGPTDESKAEQGGFEEIVYAVRQHTVVNKDGPQITVADGMGQVMDYGRYVPGARIEVRNLRTGDVRNLLEGPAYEHADVEGLDLSFDGQKVVFGMKIKESESYHIFTANLTKGADGTYGIQQLTNGDQDDLSPVWLAGGRIAFITNQMYTEMGTRADEYNHSRAVTQVATITEVGGESDRKLCSQNLSHTFNLFRMQSGQIGFSRWEHLENVNDSKLFAMNPDCTQMIALAGQHGISAEQSKPANSLVQVTETAERNVFLGIGTNREKTIQAGALLRIDARAPSNEKLHDEERAKYENLTPGVPTGDEDSPIGRYRSPHMLPDGRILVSWANGYVDDMNELSLTPPDFGIYIYDPTSRKNQLVYNDPGAWELYAQPVAKTPEPPPLDSVQNSQDSTIPMVIGSIDVRLTSLGKLHGNTVSGGQFAEGTSIDDALTQAARVRIIEGFSSEAAPNVTMFGLTMAEGAAILGEAKVQQDGSWRAEVPPFIPMHLQAIDEYGLAIRSQTTWIQGMPGEDRACGGCHEERTAPNRPTAQPLPFATGSLTEHFMTPVTDRMEFPWRMKASTAVATDYAGALGPNSKEIQSILDDKCVQCHNSSQNGDQAQEHYTVTSTDTGGGPPKTFTIGRLDLSTKEVTVTYDRKTASYPMSYVSIFYPAALEMEMGRATVTGTVPPKWGVPSDARHSALIEKINATSEFDATRTAWALDQPFSDPNIRGGVRKLHPEDRGVTLSPDERRALIRAFDMGGQYYSRQNTGFVPSTVDPTVTAAPQYAQ